MTVHVLICNIYKFYPMYQPTLGSPNHWKHSLPESTGNPRGFFIFCWVPVGFLVLKKILQLVKPSPWLREFRPRFFSRSHTLLTAPQIRRILPERSTEVDKGDKGPLGK